MTEKGKVLFFLQEEPIWCLLYDPRSAGEGWWETREEMGTAGELRSESPSRDLGQQTWHCPLPLLFEPVLMVKLAGVTTLSG